MVNLMRPRQIPHPPPDLPLEGEGLVGGGNVAICRWELMLLRFRFDGNSFGGRENLSR